MTGYIYRIFNLIDGKSYVGQTITTPKKRWALHRSPKSTCTYVRRALNLHDPQNFSLETLEIIFSEDKKDLMDLLNAGEIYYMKSFSSLYPDGYNLVGGGRNAYRGKSSKSRAGWKQTEEAKKKISLAKTGMKYGPQTPEQIENGIRAHQKAIFCKETGEYWQSIVHCAEFFDVRREAIHRVLRGIRGSFRGMTFDYVDQSRANKNRKEFKPKGPNLKTLKNQRDKISRAIKCNETKEIWSSVGEAARAIGVSRTSMMRYVQKNAGKIEGLTYSFVSK